MRRGVRDLRAGSATLGQRISEIQARTDTRIVIDSCFVWDSGPFAEEGAVVVEAAAAARGHTVCRFKTLAGRDATNLKDVAPAVLIFIASVGGISHSQRELSADGDLIAGLQLVTDVAAAELKRA